MIQYWAKPEARCGENHKMPQAYAILYKGLLKDGVQFPINNTYLDWPMSANPSEIMPSAIDYG